MEKTARMRNKDFKKALQSETKEKSRLIAFCFGSGCVCVCAGRCSFLGEIKFDVLRGEWDFDSVASSSAAGRGKREKLFDDGVRRCRWENVVNNNV